MIEMAFDVPLHEYMLIRLPGKRPNTVLAVEAQLFNIKICEYVDPMLIDRSWCYPDAQTALKALTDYILSDEADEPVGWIRAIGMNTGERRGEPVDDHQQSL